MDKKIQKTENEWSCLLSAERFHVLRNAGTERAFTSPLNDEKRDGTYYCAGCGLALFSSDHKYNSGSGWPSFWAPESSDHVETTTDWKLHYPRTEIHCAGCEGHLGHVFEDGPEPTGLRYCVNGTALNFEPNDSGSS
jgi:peptide-methionine (R)-S-oxide reductase